MDPVSDDGIANSLSYLSSFNVSATPGFQTEIDEFASARSFITSWPQGDYSLAQAAQKATG